MGGTPPVRYLPCVVPCKLYFTLEETYGSQLGEYFYYDNTYIQSINTHGSLESITYYK